MFATNDSYDSEGKFIKKRNGSDGMPQSNGRMNVYQIAKDLIQFIIIPMIGVGFWIMYASLNQNAEILRNVRETQIGVVAAIHALQMSDLADKEKYQRDTEIRAQVHHTSQKSCLECKMIPLAPSKFKQPAPDLLEQMWKHGK